MPKTSIRRVPYSSLRYNVAAARYVTPQGRFMSGAAVRQVIDDDIEAFAPRMVSHSAPLKEAAQAFKSGSITQDEYSQAVRRWRDNMAHEVKALHLSNRAAGVGGLHNMTQRDYGATGNTLREQYAYLSNFAVEAASNPDIVLGLDKSRRPFDERVKAYAEAGRNTFERAQRDAHDDAGFGYMENVLDMTSDHCTGKESCPAMTDLGRVTIDDPRYLLPGARKCVFRCKCRTTYFKEAA
jgi:hypothetical protein